MILSNSNIYIPKEQDAYLYMCLCHMFMISIATAKDKGKQKVLPYGYNYTWKTDHLSQINKKMILPFAEIGANFQQ